MLVSSPILPVPFRALFLASLLCTPLLAAPYASGDLLMGFVTGAGEGADDTVIVRLGKSADFRDNFDTAKNKLNFVTIGTHLAAKYGAEWYNRTDLYMSIFGSTDSDTIGDTLQNLDPFRTLYASRTRNAAGGGAPGIARSTAWTFSSNTAVTTTSGQMVSAAGGYSLTDTVADAAGLAIIPKSLGNTLDEYTKPAKANSFTNLNGGIEATFTAGTWGSLGDAGPVQAALDLYRIQAVNNVAGQYGFGSPIRSGVYKGSFTINQTGQVSFIAAGAAPADGFSAWAVSKGLPAGVAVTDDRDADNIIALMEYGLNLNPTAPDTLPDPAPVAGGIQLNYAKGPEAAADPKISYFLETSATLSGGWSNLPPTVNSATTITGLIPVNDPSGHLFGRLKVVRIP